MNIIIEGPDRVGKTTLIRNLKNYYNDIKFHTLSYCNVKQDHIQDYQDYANHLYNEMFNLMYLHDDKIRYNSILSKTLKYSNTGIICDRSHIGEMVYAPMYRNHNPEKMILAIESNWKYFDFFKEIILITLTCSADVLIEREDGESFSIELNKKHEEIRRFKEAHNKSNITKKILIDTTCKDINMVFNEVKEKLKGFN